MKTQILTAAAFLLLGQAPGLALEPSAGKTSAPKKPDQSTGAKVPAAGTGAKTSVKTAVAGPKTGTKTANTPGKRIVRPAVKASATPAITKSTPLPAIVDANGLPLWLNITDGDRVAKASHKYVVADFYTDWCYWCKVLDRQTFHNAKVMKYLAENVVCVKVNSEDGGKGAQLTQLQNVHSWPTVIIFDPKGRPVGRIETYVQPEDFLRRVSAVVPTASKVVPPAGK